MKQQFRTCESEQDLTQPVLREVYRFWEAHNGQSAEEVIPNLTDDSEMLRFVVIASPDEAGVLRISYFGQLAVHFLGNDLTDTEVDSIANQYPNAAALMSEVAATGKGLIFGPSELTVDGKDILVTELVALPLPSNHPTMKSVFYCAVFR